MQGTKLQAKLDTLLASKQITAWYWGHEHQCILYEPHDKWGLTARCLGNSGIPEPRKDEVRNARIEGSKGAMTWRRLEQVADKPSVPRCIALDGPNEYVVGRQEDFVPHAYMTLQFNGSTLTERIFLPDGTLLYGNSIR